MKYGLTFDQMRTIVVEAFRRYQLGNPRDAVTFKLLHERVPGLAVEMGLLARSHDGRALEMLDQEESRLADQVCWDLVRDGLVYPALRNRNIVEHFKWHGDELRLTEAGRQFLAGDRHAISDQGAYLKLMRANAAALPSADIVMVYAQEAWHAHHRGLQLGAALMVGGSMEAAAGDLLDAYLMTTYPSNADRKVMGGRNGIVPQIEAFAKSIKDTAAHKDLIKPDRDLDDGLMLMLAGMSSLFSARNGAAHPERRSPDAATVSSMLHTLPSCVDRCARLAALFQAHAQGGAS